MSCTGYAGVRSGDVGSDGSAGKHSLDQEGKNRRYGCGDEAELEGFLVEHVHGRFSWGLICDSAVGNALHYSFALEASYEEALKTVLTGRTVCAPAGDIGRLQGLDASFAMTNK